MHVDFLSIVMMAMKAVLHEKDVPGAYILKDADLNSYYTIDQQKSGWNAML